ncbi:hypothetical protein [Shimia haliotis]|uniref:Uncharacterized protein n=1 Tax=Shimia haliotis TaxID=1280847 RepID=A0A1I4F325_9RHOB|nr:hypothetical protein [Shimia haliotis]SFL11853.1 hypothetical protein SAMN04488036_105151 [Shimia haliotis]
MNQHALPDSIRLHPDETLIAVWKPAFPVFLRKLAFVSILTALLLGGLFDAFTDFSGPLVWIVGLVASAAFYAFIFDDVFEWRARRDDHWVLTNWRLLFVNPMDQSEPADLSLNNCGQAGVWMWWSVRLRLLPHGAMILPYLRDRKAVADQIAQAAAAYKAGQPQEATA